MSAIKIFSYGTLQKSKFTKGKSVTPATLEGTYKIMEGDYPLLKEISNGINRINGVVFEVTQAEIDEIDDYEGMPYLFKRQEKTVTTEDGTKVVAWIYLLSE